ncbi:unnamed protein product [Microthlaspi erraticum]|uniref:Uncharacterized protein n=1 Tax=Microthlaspi erraticum TaxID=1685480 RepID=A0A6D2KN82_9BRAS|nr:unnamed protein product [Microthlaspi erraticum]
MFSPLTTVVSSGLGRRSLEGQPMDGELELELPSNSLCSMRRLVLQNLMSIQPGSVALLSVGFTPAAHKIGVMSPPILRRLPSLMSSVVGCDLVGEEMVKERHQVPCVRSISPDPLAIACA